MQTEEPIQFTSQKLEDLDINDNLSNKAQEAPTAKQPDETCLTNASTASPFDGLGLRPEVVHTLADFGLKDLNTEQQEVIRSYTTKQDESVSLLESGTTRTVTFVAKAAVLQIVDPETREHQVLILTPTRMAGLQVTRIVRALGDSHGVKVRACIGGTPLQMDVSRLRTGVQVVIGTAGRIIDLLDRCALNTSYFKVVVLENADELLASQRFEVYQILKKLPDVRIVLLSSTMSPEIVNTMKEVMSATSEEMEKFQKEETRSGRKVRRHDTFDITGDEKDKSDREDKTVEQKEEQTEAGSA